nr:uncharacterized protein LOC111413119 [Onthophagus taurus]
MLNAPLIIIFISIITISRISTEVIEYYWRDYIGEIPKDAVEASPGLYIGQIPYNGLLPGTIYPLKQVAVSSGDGHKIESKDGVKILCCEKNNEKKFKWDYVNIKNLTPQKVMQLVRGGWENGYRLYIGKIFHEGDWKIGKIFPPGSGLQGLRIWYNNGPEYVSLDFQVLLYEDYSPINKTKRLNKTNNITYGAEP